jgi:hypothetical protein
MNTGEMLVSLQVTDSSFELSHLRMNIWGYEVAQLVEALRYKPEGRGFDSR